MAPFTSKSGRSNNHSVSAVPASFHPGGRQSEAMEAVQIGPAAPTGGSLVMEAIAGDFTTRAQRCSDGGFGSEPRVTCPAAIGAKVPQDQEPTPARLTGRARCDPIDVTERRAAAHGDRRAHSGRSKRCRVSQTIPIIAVSSFAMKGHEEKGTCLRLRRLCDQTLQPRASPRTALFGGDSTALMSGLWVRFRVENVNGRNFSYGSWHKVATRQPAARDARAERSLAT
jgi:hypothetical protein